MYWVKYFRVHLYSILAVLRRTGFSAAICFIIWLWRPAASVVWSLNWKVNVINYRQPLISYFCSFFYLKNTLLYSFSSSFYIILSCFSIFISFSSCWFLLYPSYLNGFFIYLPFPFLSLSSFFSFFTFFFVLCCNLFLIHLIGMIFFSLSFILCFFKEKKQMSKSLFVLSF